MGWYGGQDGALRARIRTSLSEALYRWGVGFQSQKNFTSLNDNKNYNVVKLVVQHPASQDAIIASINGEGGCDAIAVACSHHLNDLTKISDAVCQTLKGIFFFSTINVTGKDFLELIRRCPNLERLTLASVDDFDEAFLKNLFTENLLPNLKFLEVSHCDDDTIAAMVSAPKLSSITFRWPSPKITNDGFVRLVAAGGAKKLMSIKAGVLKKDLSKSLSMKYLMRKLPMFKSGQARSGNLENMSQGRDGGFLSPTEADLVPFAAVPLDRMNSIMIREAIRNRPHLKMPPKATLSSMRGVLEESFCIKEERAIQTRLQFPALKKDLISLKNKLESLRGSDEKVASTQAKLRKLEADAKAMIEKTFSEGIVSSTTAQDKVPFAVLPIERMTVAKLTSAIESRHNVKMPLKKNKAALVEALQAGNFSIEDEFKIQNRKHCAAVRQEIGRFKKDQMMFEETEKRIVATKAKIHELGAVLQAAEQQKENMPLGSKRPISLVN